MLENGDGSMSCDMRYKNYTIRDGKYSLPGLPAVYADNDEAQTLEIVLEDPATGVGGHASLRCTSGTRYHYKKRLYPQSEQ